MPKALIITYYWPPAGGPGVQRWLKFVKYLPDFGITPIVYIPENPNYPLVDTSFTQDIPKDITIYKHPIREPYKLARIFSKQKTKRISSGIIKSEDQSIIEKIMLWVRGNFYIPDARKNWVKPSVNYLKGIIEKEGISTIITTGPPHSVHLIGASLKEQLGVHWISDFRDPWTSIGYHNKLRLSTRSKRRHKQMERSVLNSSDHIIVTSYTTKKEFATITHKPISVITNGFDSDYNGNTSLDDHFTMSHVGSLLSGRNPSNLWTVLSELIKEHAEFAAHFKLQLVGVVSEDVLDSINEHGLKGHIQVLGYVTHEEAVSYQQRSQLLLLVEINSNETIGILPGKLYEYMAARRPILAVGPTGWEAGRLISETKTGATFEYSSKSDLKNVILDWFKSYRENKLFVEQGEIEKYHRRELTHTLATLIKWE